MNKSNPNGANQYNLDPRQKLTWELYIKPGTDYFGNAYQSAMKAGYEESTASQITTENWFLEKLRRLNMLSKAEKVLDEILELITFDEKGIHNPALLKIKQDSAKFLAERLGKAEGYSTRTELSGPNGDSLQPILVKFIDEPENNLNSEGI